MGEALAQVLQVDQFQQFSHYVVFARVLADTEDDVVGHAQMGKQRVVLEHHADATFLGGQGVAGAGNDLAGQADFTFVHRLEPGNRTQCGGFSTPR